MHRIPGDAVPFPPLGPSVPATDPIRDEPAPRHTSTPAHHEPAVKGEVGAFQKNRDTVTA